MSRFRPSLNGPSAMNPAAGGGITLPPVFFPPSKPAAANPEPKRSEQAPASVDTSKERISAVTVLLGLYTFMHVAPFAEIYTTFLKINIPIVAATGLIVSIVALGTGRLLNFFELGISKPWVVLWILMAMSCAFGMYPGGTYGLVLNYGSRLHMFPFLVCAVALTPKQIRHLMYWSALACPLMLLVCMLYGTVEEGRFFVRDIPLMANPNDMAFILIYSAIFVMLLGYRKHALIRRLMWLASIAGVCAYVFRSGSRSAFFTLALLAVVMLIFAPFRTRIAALILVPVLSIAIIPIVPKDTLRRLTYVVSDPTTANPDSQMLEGALSSQVARTLLQERALTLALKHPLLGVGPNMFMDAVEEYVRKELRQPKSTWENTHNVYLQMAAENGIIAMILFVASMWFCVSTNIRNLRLCFKIKELKDVQPQTMCLLLGSFAFAFSLGFVNFAYTPHFPILVALTAGNALAIKRERERLGV